jgi:hypothetical protein
MRRARGSAPGHHALERLRADTFASPSARGHAPLAQARNETPAPDRLRLISYQTGTTVCRALGHAIREMQPAKDENLFGRLQFMPAPPKPKFMSIQFETISTEKKSCASALQGCHRSFLFGC